MNTQETTKCTVCGKEFEQEWITEHTESWSTLHPEVAGEEVDSEILHSQVTVPGHWTKYNTCKECAVKSETDYNPENPNDWVNKMLGK